MILGRDVNGLFSIWDIFCWKDMHWVVMWWIWEEIRRGFRVWNIFRQDFLHCGVYGFYLFYAFLRFLIQLVKYFHHQLHIEEQFPKLLIPINSSNPPHLIQLINPNPSLIINKPNFPNSLNANAKQTLLIVENILYLLNLFKDNLHTFNRLLSCYNITNIEWLHYI